MSFLRIRENFRNGLWTKKMVAEAVNQGYINKAEYYAIVGEPYSKDRSIVCEVPDIFDIKVTAIC